LAVEGAGAEVEHPLVGDDLPVAHVERLVVDEEADELAVGDVDDRLAGLRVAVATLRVRQRVLLEVARQVGALLGDGLTLVEVAAQPEVAVGQREERLDLAQRVDVKALLAQAPGLDRQRVTGHRSSSRSSTTTSAPLARRSSAWPSRSTATTYPNLPARPAATPAMASSNTAASAGVTSRRRAASRKVSGAGLPGRPSAWASDPSTSTSIWDSRPVTSRTSAALALEETTAHGRPWARAASR